jgi:hypothetical protein
MCNEKINDLNLVTRLKGSNFQYKSLPNYITSGNFSQPCVTFKHIVTQHVKLPRVGLVIIEVASTMSKTHYNDLRIMHQIPRVVFVLATSRSFKPHCFKVSHGTQHGAMYFM